MFIAHGDLEVIDFKGICFLMDHPKLFWICTFSSTYTSIRRITNGLNKSDVQNLTVKVFASKCEEIINSVQLQSNT